MHSARNVEAEKLKEILAAKRLFIKEVHLHCISLKLAAIDFTYQCACLICFQITPDGHWYVIVFRDCISLILRVV